MADGKIHLFTGQSRGNVVKVIAEYEGLNFEYIETNPRLKASTTGWEDYAAKFPFQKVPALEKNGFLLFEVLAIISYIVKRNNKANLLGKTPEEEAQITQWLSFLNMEFNPRFGQCTGHLRADNPAPYNKPAVAQAEAELEHVVNIVEKHLHTRTFLVGHRITAADIMLAAFILRGCAFTFDKEWRSKHINVTRHMHTLINQPQFKSVVPSPVILDEAVKYVPPKKEEKHKKEEAKKEPAPKKEKAKKEEEDEDEPLVPAEPKAKHPCEALGPVTSFPLDEWKRQYSNNDTKVAMKWLEEKYNPQEYSLWKVVYKYPEELTQVYMSSNLIGGFHTRLEASRKYLFGSSGVYGENNKSKIQGAYMLRGSDYKAVFDVGPDHESYEFSSLDFSKPEDREFIEGCWAWTNEFDGLKYADGKVFK